MEKMYITFQINKKEAINIKFLVYRDKKYPFNFDLIKQNSNYFFEREKLYQNIKEIRLLSENEEEIINLSDDTIQTFISCCQAEQCRISIANIIELQYLSNKFGVTQLVTHINKYLSENWLIHALDSLLFKIRLMSKLVEKDFKEWEERYYTTWLKYQYPACPPFPIIVLRILSLLPDTGINPFAL